jgi:DNA-binding PadR family transcriptional regulator
MTEKRQTDFVILGLLRHESLTGYEIKKRMDSSVFFFWSASFGSIYPALTRLVQEGLATAKTTIEKGREKITYTITQKGITSLDEWLSAPVLKDEIRFETLLKFYFANPTTPQNSKAHLSTFQKQVERQLPMLIQEMAVQRQRRKDSKNAEYSYLTLQFGVELYKLFLKWCVDTDALLDASQENEPDILGKVTDASGEF